MTTDTVNVRSLILDILIAVLEKGGYSHRVIGAVLEKYQYLDKKERAFLTRVSEGTIQRKIELDYITDRFSKIKTEKMKPVIRNLLRMSVYQLRYMDAVPDSAVCNEAVKLAKKRGFTSLGGFVNGVLRSIAGHAGDISYPDETVDPVRAYSVRYSMPEWIVRQWMENYGAARTVSMLEVSLTQAPFTIRTNLTRISSGALRERLESEGISAIPVQTGERGVRSGYPPLPYAFVLSGVDYPGRMASFAEGLFYVQDISSMVVAEWADPREGDYCIDVCAAPGGKSIHLAEKLCGTGHVLARDLTPWKVEQIRENIERQQLRNITAECMDATAHDKESEGKADLVIADLPCSGLGVLRRKTDIRYRMSAEQQEELAELQRRILSNVCAFVKPGGKLIYSTCTVSRPENEDNVRWFTECHPEFVLTRMHQFFPEENAGDGFFLAECIRRKHVSGTADRDKMENSDERGKI